MLLRVCFRSAGRHLAWFARSWLPGCHPGAPLGPRRILFLLVLFPLFCAVQSMHWLGFLLDECLFRAYRKVSVSKPLFISGIPRSGTTFVHRTLVSHGQNFTGFATWEALLAPSVTERKVFRTLGAIDRALGGPCGRGLRALVARAGGDFHAIHEIAPSAPEEDYLALLPAGGCFLLAFAFPFSTHLRGLGTLDTLPPGTRRELLDFYRRLLQKHLYCAPEGSRLISKNAAFASWLSDLREQFPDARFLLCVREPVSALSSQLSALTEARRLFGTDPGGEHTKRLMTDTFTTNYAALRQFLDRAGPASVALIDQADLGSAPGPHLAAAAEHLGLDPFGDLAARLSELPPQAASGHRHSPADHAIDAEWIDRYLHPEYSRILRSEARIVRPEPL